MTVDPSEALRRPAAPAPVAVHERELDGLAHLVASISLLKRAEEIGKRPSMAVGSKKMFEEMVSDYEKSAERIRLAALTAGAEPRATEAGEAANRECKACGAFKPDPNAACGFCGETSAALTAGPEPRATEAETEAMEAVMASVDPATWPGLSVRHRAALGRFAKPAAPNADKPEGEAAKADVLTVDTADVLATWAESFMTDQTKLMDLAIGMVALALGEHTVTITSAEVGELIENYQIVRTTLPDNAGWTVKLLPRANADQGNLDLDGDPTNYEDWIKMGRRLYDSFQGGATGYENWKAWSMTTPNFDETALRRKWESFSSKG